MVDMKIAIETYFSIHWTQTPIQWQGMKFVQPNDRKWIAINFSEIDSETSIDGNIATDEAQMRILSYGTTPNESLTINADVRAFLEFYRFDKSGIVESYGSDGLGTLDLGNGVFETSSLFKIKRTQKRG